MFFNAFKKLYQILDRRGRRSSVLVFILILVAAFTEMLGVASIMPFVLVLSQPDALENSKYLQYVKRLFVFESNERFVIFLGFTMLFVLIGAIVLKALVTLVTYRFSLMRGCAFSRQLVSGYLRQPYSFFLNSHSADLGKTILDEANQVVSNALRPMMEFFANLASASAIIFLLVLVAPLLSSVILLGLGLSYALIFYVVRGRLTRLGRQSLSANRERYRVVQETFGGIKEVKLTGTEAAFARRFERVATLLARLQADAKVLKYLPAYAIQILMYGGMFAVILYQMTQPGGLQAAIPTLAMFALGTQRLIPALSKIYQNLSYLRYSMAELGNVHQSLHQISSSAAPDNKPEGKAAKLQFTESIHLDNIHYAYPGAEGNVLSGLTLSIPAHTKVGLVGTSGSGKTTTVDIIMGLLQPASGTISVDGQAIVEANRRAWQNSIGYVPQQIFLMDDTVSANIAFGIPGDKIDHDAVERAARLANLHEFVTLDLPQAYSTRIGERGVRLSGGQRQRIGIARALYHDPDVLILDEATSALDTINEHIVMNAVHGLSRRKTIILIAHRLSTVKECDCLFVFDKGQVIAMGTYDELAASNANFQGLLAQSG